MNLKKLLFLAVCLISQISFSQEGVAVYSDYLSDNYYLLHPSMAGAANCAKLRVTARQQWFGQKDAPAMQTVSFNGSLTEQSGVGAIVYNDKNGYHAQKGSQINLRAPHYVFKGQCRFESTFFWFERWFGTEYIGRNRVFEIGRF
jgi:hypothetical protein